MSSPVQGRGAGFNTPNRFEPFHLEPLPDEPVDGGDAEPRSLPTQLYVDSTRSILAENDSPDLGFRFSINPYRGCEHGCSYSLDTTTPILMADGTTRPLEAVRPGDRIYGTVRQGWYRRYAVTTVLDRWEVKRPTYRVTLEDGTELVAGDHHQFLTERGWTCAAGLERQQGQRPHLTVNNKLMGIGALVPPSCRSEDYAAGYLCGMIHGDGWLTCPPPGRSYRARYRFGLALTDSEALDRSRAYLQLFGVPTRDGLFFAGSETTRPLHMIRASSRARTERIQQLITWPNVPSTAWYTGFLAGIFDAEGSYSGGVLRISNTDAAIVDNVVRSLRRLAFDFVLEIGTQSRNKPITYVRLRGSLREHYRFFHTVDPAISRKRSIEGQGVKSQAKLGVVSVEPLGVRTLLDITTGTGDFIANGVVSHNCYARSSHEYLGFSAGLDFESKILVKPDAPELLEEAFRRKSWEPQLVVFSGNTDCYQPVERRLELTRSCLEVFLKFRNPVGVITKSHLVTRDLDLLAELAALNLVKVTLSITTLDPELQRKMEPRAATPERRLDAVEKIAARGIPVGVNIAPVIPGLTDEEIPAILRESAARGATSAACIMVRLSGPVEPLFVEWLERELPLRAPRVLHRLREVREGKLNDTRWGVRMRGEGPIADGIRDLFDLMCRRCHLNETETDLTVEHFRVPRPQLELF